MTAFLFLSGMKNESVVTSGVIIAKFDFFLIACPDHKGAKSSTNCCEELVHLCDTW